MSNLINNNFQNVKLVLDKEDYWDFFIHKGSDSYYSFNNNSIYDDCLISYFDLSNHECVSKNEIKSLDTYMWHCAHNDGKVFNNIGYTGFDNGLLHFRRDKILNKEFIELYANSKFELKSDELNVVLRAVSGSSTNYEYPISVIDDCVKFNGGFYQGFFKTNNNEYQVLPSSLGNGETWSFEFVLNKTDFEKESNKTLNDKYSDNKGIFFYIGTRAENKWAYLYNKDYEDECFQLDMSDYIEGAEIDLKTYKLTAFTDMDIILPIEHDYTFTDNYLNDKQKGGNGEYDDLIFDLFEENDNTLKYRQLNDTFEGCEIFGDDYMDSLEECITDYIASDEDISETIYKTVDGFDLDKQQYYIDVDNEFLLYNRTCDGLKACDSKENVIERYVGTKHDFKENLFLLMNRTCTGYTTCDIDKLKEQSSVEYNVLSDLYNNALAFRIKDDGSIGYRYLIKNCENDEKYEIKEAYSKSNIIKDGEWCVIHIKIESIMDKMKIKFYVNGNLVFISDELPMLNLRELNDLYEKQETVPYNISLGGGTQGLIETVLPNYMVDPYRVYPLERYFAGSFIGYIKSFKFYTCNLEINDISNNFKVEINNLKNV